MEKELIICDTNVIIDWFKCDDLTIENLEKIGLKNILIPSITIMELIQGVRNKKELDRLRKKLNNYNIIHYNEEVSDLSIELMKEYNLSHNLLIPDSIIAAIALFYRLKLYTHNLKDFDFIPSLKLYYASD